MQKLPETYLKKLENPQLTIKDLLLEEGFILDIKKQHTKAISFLNTERLKVCLDFIITNPLSKSEENSRLAHSSYSLFLFKPKVFFNENEDGSKAISQEVFSHFMKFLYTDDLHPLLFSYCGSVLTNLFKEIPKPIYKEFYFDKPEIILSIMKNENIIYLKDLIKHLLSLEFLDSGDESYLQQYTQKRIFLLETLFNNLLSESNLLIFDTIAEIIISMFDFNSYAHNDEYNRLTEQIFECKSIIKILFDTAVASKSSDCFYEKMFNILIAMMQSYIKLFTDKENDNNPQLPTYFINGLTENFVKLTKDKLWKEKSQSSKEKYFPLSITKAVQLTCAMLSFKESIKFFNDELVCYLVDAIKQIQTLFIHNPNNTVFHCQVSNMFSQIIDHKDEFPKLIQKMLSTDIIETFIINLNKQFEVFRMNPACCKPLFIHLIKISKKLLIDTNLLPETEEKHKWILPRLIFLVDWFYLSESNSSRPFEEKDVDKRILLLEQLANL